MCILRKKEWMVETVPLKTAQEMFDMGCEMVGRFAKHKFKHITSRLS